MERTALREGSQKVVKVVSITSTLKQIPKGSTVRYTVRDMFLPSVRACACRLNKELGREEYTVTIYDNGAEFDVTRQ